jgi:N-acetylmuramoyl-L-alanine amidase
MLWDLVQNEYIAESSTFAEYVQKAMTDRLGIQSRGVKQANFVVLQGAKMPAVLIEVAFLSNPAEEQMLADPEFQSLVADGVIEAIRRVQERYR